MRLEPNLWFCCCIHPYIHPSFHNPSIIPSFIHHSIHPSIINPSIPPSVRFLTHSLCLGVLVATVTDRKPAVVSAGAVCRRSGFSQLRQRRPKSFPPPTRSAAAPCPSTRQGVSAWVAHSAPDTSVPTSCRHQEVKRRERMPAALLFQLGAPTLGNVSFQQPVEAVRRAELDRSSVLIGPSSRPRPRRLTYTSNA